MKQAMKTAAAALAGMVAGMGILLASASGAQPGSEMDPLVTKSYVDQQIAALQAGMAAGGGTGTTGGTTPSTGATPMDSEEVAQLKTDVGELTHFIIDALTGVDSLKARMNSLESGFVVVEVPAGKTILLNGGSEAIVRSGSATAVGGTYGGLADVTSGADLKTGAAITNQHLLISSRSDGRGLKIGPNTVFLLVRGGYSLK